MSENNLLNTVQEVFKAKFTDKYLTPDGDFIVSKIREDLEKLDDGLVAAFLDNEELAVAFTKTVGNHTLFDGHKLAEMLSYDSYWQGSYTKYANKIGLTAGGKYLDESLDVVLDFPYKDTVLTANMSKESEKLKELRDEPFLNEVIAKNDIDVLLDKKILKNAKRYDKEHLNGSKVIDFDENTDNLIIKGNNLLALHTLKEKYAGKVKLIYLDPPYNTGNDSFLYNDRFNHSTWLTFMKNRLEVAKELLSDDGLIFIQTDYNEDSYIKVLMDSIFGLENYISTITVKSNSISGNKTQHRKKTILKNKDSIQVFQKGNKEVTFNPQYSIKTEWDTHYNSILEKENGEYHIEKLKDVLIENSLIQANEAIKPSIWSDKKFREFAYKNRYLIFRRVNSIPDSLKELSLATPERIVFIEREDGTKMFAEGGKRLSFLANVYQNINGEDELAQLLGDLWTDIDFQNTQNQGGVDFTNAKKPEQLISRIINLSTNENDLVLDFFMGSATTQAVAMKMKRRFIGIEQMDYINTVSVERLKKVIDGEQGGISKSVNWQGGGSFVYAELMEKNTGFIREVADSTTIPQLQAIFERMKNRGDIDFRVNEKALGGNLVLWKDELGESLNFEQIQKLLIRVIDKNQLYYNYSEMDDKSIKELLSDDELKFNENFYGER